MVRSKRSLSRLVRDSLLLFFGIFVIVLIVLSTTDQDENIKRIMRVPRYFRGQLMPQAYFTGPSNDRQTAVVAAFKHAWKGYKEFAWGYDNLRPISKVSSNWFGLGLTIVDSLDTIYIMDLQEEFEEARKWVEEKLDLEINVSVSLFEVTIRALGGLLSAYHLSGHRMFLTKATDLGDRLLPAFRTPTGIPYSDVNLETGDAHSPTWTSQSTLSEVASVQLEFKDLSWATNNRTYEQAVGKVNEVIHAADKPNGLASIDISPSSGKFATYSTITLGARGDSYYEYLLKQWIQGGKKENDYLIEDYKTAINGVIEKLVRTTPNENLMYVGEILDGDYFSAKMDHLVCFLPGTLLLGYKNGMPDEHLALAEGLMETCYQMYMKQPTQLSPEVVYFNVDGESETDMFTKSSVAYNLLRPEFVESLYYFYALTGNATYQDWGWTIFNAFEKYTKVEHGYTSIGNVGSVEHTRPKDNMESFFLAETLKYFYLLFSDDRKEVDLGKFVFNTEAHLLPIRGN